MEEIKFLKDFKELDLKEMLRLKHVRCVDFEGNKWIEIKEDADKDWDKVSIYDIQLDRIADYEGILRWSHHLSQKMWVTRELLREFIEVCATQLDLSLFVNR